MKKENLELAIAGLKKDLETFEIDQDKHEEAYKELIDESGPVLICGMSFTASRILEEVDPIAFRCGLNDYVDSLDVTEDEEYKELEEKLADLESELEPINSLHEAWENCDKIKIFEFPVIDKRTGGKEYVTFDISIVGDQFVAQHEALSLEQEQSNMIASVWIDIDYDFSLDENLQALHEACTYAIMDSTFFELAEE